LHDEVHVTTLFVTHDQEEALEVADEIVVINGGRIEQVGSPADLYDHPANAFVMSFLGPVTRLAGTLVRPHDLEVLTDERAGAVQATVTKLLRVGYEVRVETSTAGGETPWVQLTRAQVEELGLATGQTVWLRALVATPFAATEGAAAREAARGGDAAGSSDAHAGPDAAGDPLPTTTVRA
jgi:sulfate/thiosulfate transport system ATP-binding protein